MEVNTQIHESTPKRIVSGFQGHHVGGVGTPKDISLSRGSMGYLEVACFSSGCLFRCPTCQNWYTTYLSNAQALKPEEAAVKLTARRQQYSVDRMAISGGESTLNRKWLVDFVSYLRKFNPDEKARIHVDTNAAILTTDYVDELIGGGMTDIGPDLKGIRLETFMKLTNLLNEKLAEKYLKTSWNSVKYIIDNYLTKIFIGVGIPYNKELISLDEIFEMGTTLIKWDPNIQVTVLDYRPEFRAQTIIRPSYEEMKNVKNALEDSGLKKVICQTSTGYLQ
jgi:pyruvate formate lyase activating enzyme